MNKKFIVLVAVLAIATIGGYLFPQVKNFPVGSVAGPDSTYEYYSVNGVAEYKYSTPLNNASTTICSIKSPMATSTLLFASLNISTGTSTVLQIDMGHAVGNNTATTTALGTKFDLATTKLATIIATTTNPAAVVFGPGEYFNVRFSPGSAITNTVNSLKGACKAEFIVN